MKLKWPKSHTQPLPYVAKVTFHFGIYCLRIYTVGATRAKGGRANETYKKVKQYMKIVDDIYAYVATMIMVVRLIA